MEPASIRTKNPGAMWGRTGPRPSSEREAATNAPIPLKWGSTDTIYLSDGLGQGNNIAVFPTFLQGICAQLDLWRTSAHYRNKRFVDAIHTWSGGNNVPSYVAYVKQRVPGITEDTIMDDAFWRGPLGLGFLKAQAGHEAGKPYPAAEEDWAKAQKIVMSGVLPPVKKKPSKTVVAATTSVVIATGAAAQQASTAGHGGWIVGLILCLGLAVVGAGVWFFHFRKEA